MTSPPSTMRVVTGHERSLLRSEEHDRPGDLVRQSHAPQERGALFPVLRRAAAGDRLGLDPARRHAVDAHAEGRAFHRQRTRQRLHRRFGNAVVAPVAVERRRRGDVDDRPLAGLGEQRHRIGRDVIGRLQIWSQELVQALARGIVFEHALIAARRRRHC